MSRKASGRLVLAARSLFARGEYCDGVPHNDICLVRSLHRNLRTAHAGRRFHADLDAGYLGLAIETVWRQFHHFPDQGILGFFES
jgi:hypothetical protein